MKQLAILIAALILIAVFNGLLATSVQAQSAQVFPHTVQNTESELKSPGFDLIIKDHGWIDLKGLTNFPNLPSSLPYQNNSHGTNMAPAVLDNLVTILRAIDTNANFVLERFVSTIDIDDIQYHSAANSKLYVSEIIAALSAASGKRLVFDMPTANLFVLKMNSGVRQNASDKADIDVFNLNNYFLMQTIIDDDAKEKVVREIQSEVEQSLETLADLKRGFGKLEFSFHPKTGLLVVFGDEFSREVARKFITALNQSFPLSTISTNK